MNVEALFLQIPQPLLQTQITSELKLQMVDKQVGHNQYQRQYFDNVERSRLAIGETLYTQAHVDRMVTEADLHRRQRILEIGAGPGKFTLQLAGLGLDVIANDLSPVLLKQLDRSSGGLIKTIACDVLEIAQFVDVPFDRVVGFFVLHHLRDFENVFAALASVMRPGARVVFCEPFALNPLYYIQILFTPGMHFTGEPSITSMRQGIILPALIAAGFVNAEAHGYGYFPPALKNNPFGDRLEKVMDRCKWIPFPHAFQVFSANMPE